MALVAACRRFAAEGIGAAEATKRLKRRSEFPVRKAYGAAESWRDNELAAALVRLAEPRRRVERREPVTGRARTRARARGGQPLAGDEARRLRLAAGGGVPMERAAGDGAVEPAHEVAVRGLHVVLVASLDRVAELARERAHGRAVADVLRALSLGRPDALLLLADVRYSERLRCAGGSMVPEGRRRFSTYSLIPA